jgi:hypothetical protein
MMTAVIPSALLELSDRDFRRVIDQVLFPPGDDAWPPLLASGVAERTHATLTTMLTEVEAELTSRAAELEQIRQECWARGPAGRDEWFRTQAEYQDWRRRAVRAKQAILRRKQAAKVAARATRRNWEAELRQYRDAVRLMAAAIVAHHQASAREGIDPEPHDQTLWDVLKSVAVPHYGRSTPVAELLEDGVWHME